MEKKTAHIGVISVPEDEILKLLDFVDGSIIAISQKGGRFNSDIEVTIAHRDMPEVVEGDLYPPVLPAYITYQDAFGGKVRIRDKELKL